MGLSFVSRTLSSIYDEISSGTKHELRDTKVRRNVGNYINVQVFHLTDLAN